VQHGPLVRQTKGLQPCYVPDARDHCVCMSMMQHPSFRSSSSVAADRQDLPVTAELAAIYISARHYADRACCCAAKPAVIAIIPAGNGRRAAADLLLCGHHYRRSRAVLSAKSAILLDVKGYPLATAWPEPVC
jgi:hypothetical protein